jgi:thiol:disulfide interchange protein DsbD
MFNRFILAVLFLIFSYSTSYSLSFDAKTNYISVEAIPEYQTITPSTKELNILYKIDILPSWHMYWSNPGDVGDPTKITTSNKEIKIKDEIFSTPTKIVFEDIITSYIHKNTFYIKQLIDFNDKPTSILDFNLTYNICNDECIKEELPITIELPNLNTATPNNKYLKQLSKAQTSFPTPITTTANINENIISLDFNNNIFNTCYSPEFVSIYPKKDILSSLPKTSINTTNKLDIIFDDKSLLPQDSKGIIICNDKTYITSLSNPPVLPKNIFYYILISFLAGLILNLMPCVLPVLSLKTLHLVNSHPKTSISSAFLYLLGVECCFLSLSGIIFYTKSLGSSLGWGFQLQSIGFNIFLLLLFFIIFLNLTDKIQFSDKLSNFLTKISKNQSFLTGFFAVIIATPCSGPFMGSAIGYSLLASNAEFFTIFIFLGLGYALPYVLIELNPSLLHKYLPQTGTWMIKLKHWLSIPIALTCLWLGWVIYSQLNIISPKENISWQKYSQSKLGNALQNNRPVFINFTAKWCLVCLLNDKTTLSTKDFKQLAQKNDVLLLKADWTNKDEDITKALQNYNRNSIPLYVYYPKNNKDKIILPQILTINKIKQTF